MFSKLIPLALCALSVVQAISFSFNNNGISCVTNNRDYEVTIQMDFSVQDQPGAKPLKLFNVGTKGAVFAAPGGEILSHRSDANPGNNGLWTAVKLTGGSDRYIIRNVGLDAYVVVGANNAVVTSRTANPAVFILQATAGDVYKIRLEGQNLFWEGVYGGVNTQYGYVALKPPSAGNQDWRFTK